MTPIPMKGDTYVPIKPYVYDARPKDRADRWSRPYGLGSCLHCRKHVPVQPNARLRGMDLGHPRHRLLPCSRGMKWRVVPSPNRTSRLGRSRNSLHTLHVGLGSFLVKKNVTPLTLYNCTVFLYNYALIVLITFKKKEHHANHQISY